METEGIKVRTHFLWMYRLLTWWWPDIVLLMPIKRALLRLIGFSIGNNVNISSDVVFSGGGKVSFGNNVVLQRGVRIDVGAAGNVALGDDVVIRENCMIQAFGTVIVGDRTEVNHGSMLSANGTSKLQIGNDCQIAHMVSLKTSQHFIEPKSQCIAGRSRFDNITIGSGSWLCAGVIVIPGVSVGKKNVIAAGAVVTTDTPDYVLMAGVPAQKKRVYEND